MLVTDDFALAFLDCLLHPPISTFPSGHGYARGLRGADWRAYAAVPTRSYRGYERPLDCIKPGDLGGRKNVIGVMLALVWIVLVLVGA